MKLKTTDIEPRASASRSLPGAFLVALVLGLACHGANAAVTILGAQYHPDQMFPFGCYWNPDAYPNCPTSVGGATVHVYLKNTGASAVTVNYATLAGYNLSTVIKTETGSGLGFSSIYYFWGQSPPADILAAGEPVWSIANPTSIPAGGVGQVTVRLRNVPTTPTLTVGAVTSGGTVATNITVDVNAPQVANIGYSDDLTKVYLQWRRPGGAAPKYVYLDGTEVTSLTTTVGDTNFDFGASVISLANALPFFSGHVYQGVYADGKTATAWQHAWTNKFIYCTYGTFVVNGDASGAGFMANASAHGFNSIQFGLGDLGSYIGHNAGCNDALARGYGYTITDPAKLNGCMDPEMWLLVGGDSEPDATEYNRTTSGNSPGCGTGNKIPCGYAHSPGVYVQTLGTVHAAAVLAKAGPNVPITANLDGTFEPWEFYHYGPALDILEADNYYEVRLKDAYWYATNRIPVFNQAKVSYAVARTGTAAAEPNPFVHLLYSTKWKDTSTGNIWPYPFPASKHMEAYYSLAGGSKGMGYWWLSDSPGYPSYGLTSGAESAPLWKEMGLIGNEIKTARPMLVRSTPVDLPLAPGTNVWARALGVGTDTILLLIVNDNYYNNQAGCHYTPVSNATVTATLPSWMQASPAAFGISAAGLSDVSTVLNGNQLQLNLGTLNLVQMIVVTTDPTLRPTIQTRYTSLVQPNVCSFAPEYCVNFPPSITKQPTNQAVVFGGTANLTVVASGTAPLSYQWRLNGTNVAAGTTTTLTLVNVQGAQAGTYTLQVTNAYGSALSSGAVLTVLDPWIVGQPTNRAVTAGTPATFAVSAVGTAPLGYQWRKAGVPLTDGTNINGALTASLTVAHVQAADTGTYSVTVSNLHGQVTSSNATLVANYAPVIVTQPANQAVLAGSAVTFTVGVSGSSPMSFHWQQAGANVSDGEKFSGSATASLSVSAVQVADIAGYSVVVSNTYGTVTSSNALLSLWPLVSWGRNNLSQADIPGGLANVTAISAGLYHNLALCADGTVVAWGAGTNNTGSNPNYGQALVPSGLTNVAAIAAGTFHSLALCADGTVVAWGAGTNNTGATPHFGQSMIPAGLTKVSAVAAGGYHSAALKQDGTVVAWGNNNYGQANVPGGLSNVVAVAAGGYHTLALKVDGAVVAWGAGASNTGASPNYGQSAVPGDLSNVVAVAAGAYYSLALKADGTVVAWGYNGAGQTNVPGGLANAVAVAGGVSHGLALEADGTLVAWGDSTYSQADIPAGLTNVMSIAAGGYHDVVLENDGSPSFTVQPASQAAAVGATVRLIAMAVGQQPLSYQWQRDGMSLAGATTNSLTLAGVQYFDAGAYTLLAGNPLGNATSSVANLTVPGALRIINATVQDDGSLSLSAAGKAGQTCVLLMASDLNLPLVWSPIQTNQADSDGLVQFTDPGVTNQVQRFYRLQAQ